MILCILSDLVYNYEDLKLVDLIVSSWGITHEMGVIGGNTVYGLFYTNEYVVLAFKGTSSLKDVLSDINLIQVDDQYGIPGKIHKGFHDLVLTNNIAETLEEKIDEILDSGKKQIFITGHSLGAALATVFYSFLRKSEQSNVNLTTFGCPKVGDSDFAKFTTDSIRVVNGNDMVTSLPLFNYSHSQALKKIGSNLSFNFLKDHYLANYFVSIQKIKK